MSSRLLAVAIDARDATALVDFWAKVLGRDGAFSWDDGTGRTYVEVPGEPALLFQRVPERKAGKNRLHLDLVPAAGTQEAETARLTGFGSRVIDPAPDFPWVVLIDPEGNEFCVLPPR